MKKLIENVSNFSKPVASLFHIVIFLLMILGISTLELKNNDDADLPVSDPIVKTNKQFEEIFGAKDKVLISLESENAYSVDSLNATREITQKFIGVKWVSGDEIKSLFTNKNISSSVEGLEVNTLYKNEVIDSALAKKIESKARKNDLIHGRITSSDGRSSLILVNVIKGVTQSEVYRDTMRIVEPYREKFKVRVIGSLIFSEAMDLGIEADAMLLFPLAIFVQAIVFFLLFKSARIVLICIVSIVVSIVWTMGLMGWVDYPVTVLSSSVPLLMTIVSGSFTIHYVCAFLRYVNRDNSVEEAIKLSTNKVYSPLLLTAFTSAVGASSLYVFKVTTIAEFGIVTAMGIVASFFVVFSLLPVLFRVFFSEFKSNIRAIEQTKKTISLSEKFTRYLSDFSIFCFNHVKVILLGLIGFIFVGSFIVGNLRVGANFTDYLPDGNVVKTDMAYFDESLGGSRYFNILIEAGENDGIQEPQLLKKVDEIQAYIESLDHVGKTMSFVQILKRIDAVIQERDRGIVPDSFEEVAQYLFLYSISSSPDDFSDIIDYDYRRLKIYVPIKTSEQDDHIIIYNKIRTFIDKTLPDNVTASYGGNLLVWIAQMRYVVQGKILNIIFTILAVFFICLIYFRSVKLAIIAMVPISFMVFCTFVIMVLTGIRLEISTAVITGITVGIGIDFTCHFLHHFKEGLNTTGDKECAIRLAVQASGAAILFDIIVTIFGFSVFLFSGFTPIQYFGLIVATNMAVAGLATFLLVPALIKVFFSERLAPSKLCVCFVNII